MRALRPGAASAAEIAARLAAARADLDQLVAALPGGGSTWPYLPTVNPPRWEYGHTVWFQEHWCLRLKPGRDPRASPLLEPLEPSRQAWADWLFDSSHIPHRARWEAPLPGWDALRGWSRDVQAAVTARLETAGDDTTLRYFAELAFVHERMHIEAWWMMFQTIGIAPPRVPAMPSMPPCETLNTDAGRVLLGTPEDADHFVFDNEREAHEVHVGAFACDSRPVTCAEFARFVDAGGYALDRCWDGPGRRWRAEAGAEQPIWWRRGRDGWELRRFDRWIPLPEDEPVVHVNRHEARAYATWRERRLPSAAEWMRASTDPRFRTGRCWEWTGDPFRPYPGFSPGPYADYSLPWFETHAELRGGGSWVTDPTLARATLRNFYTPDRRDPFVGFRTAGDAPGAARAGRQ